MLSVIRPASTRSDSKLASARLAIVSPKEDFIARSAHPRGSKAAQSSKPVQVQTATLSSANFRPMTLGNMRELGVS